MPISLSINVPSPESLAEIRKSLARSKSSVDASGLLPRSRAAVEDLNFGPRSIARNQALSTNERGRFIQENKDLLHVIDQSDEAFGLLRKSQISSRDDLKEIIAYAARETLNADAKRKISTNLLKQETSLSSLLLLNKGGVRDFFNDDPELVSLLSDKEGSYQQSVTREVAKKAASQFSSGHVLADQSFFNANPDAALYVLSNPAQAENFAKFSSQAQDFKQRVRSNDLQRTLENHVTQSAAELTNSATFNQDFFSQNEQTKELARFVVAGNYVDGIPEVSTFLKSNLSFGLNNIVADEGFSIDSIVKNVLGLKTKNKLGSDSELSSDFLKQNAGFSQLVLQDSDFTKLVQKKDVNQTLKFLSGQDVKMIQLSEALTNEVQKRFVSRFADPSPVVNVVA